MILTAIIPVFLVILFGFVFSKTKHVGTETEQFIHQFVLNLSLPAVLFLAVAQAETAALLHTAFLCTVLGGIAIAYGVAVIWAKFNGISHPQASLIGMGGSYGTTGFMGIPLLLMAFGDSMGVVAAIATILHNIPVIITVIASHDIQQKSQSNRAELFKHLNKVVFSNPLMLSVLAGACFAFTPLTLPESIVQFCRFFGAAAGPCALFSLGLGLAKISHVGHFSKQHLSNALVIVAIKLFLHPLVTFVIGYYGFSLSLDDPYFICAVMMSALPVGVATHVFAKNYRFYDDEIAIAIVVSLIVAFPTLSYLLYLF